MTILRRNDRAISKAEAMAILHKAEYGILSTVSADGQPYGVPLSFCIMENSLYFHHAVEGRLIENIENKPIGSFCAVGDTELIPNKFATKYESVIVYGNIEEVFDAQKKVGLELFLKKYSSDFIENGRKFIKNNSGRTRVFRMTICDISGKARKK